MFRKIFVILVAIIVIFGSSKLSFAMMCGGHNRHQQTAQAEHSEPKQEAVTESASKETINIGNKICPVSGDKIDEKLKATYEYEGKIYNFCCSMCIEEFKKDPEKYIKKIEEELKNSSVNTGTDESAADTKTQVSPSIHQGHKH